MTVFGIAVGVKTKFLVTMSVKEDSIRARIIKHVFHSIGDAYTPLIFIIFRKKLKMNLILLENYDNCRMLIFQILRWVL